MRDLTPDTITRVFAEYSKNAPSARTRDLLVSLAGHLHSFVRENKVTQKEWEAGIDALTRAMKFTDDKRNEYILLSDLLGVSSLVDMVNANKSGTPSSVLGPFHAEGGAHRQQEGAQGADRRPRAGIDEMIRMLLLGHVAHPPFPVCAAADSAPSKVFARSVLAS